MDGLVLAGGRSSRMGGRHKGGLVYHNRTFTEILIEELGKEAENVWLSYGRDNHGMYEKCEVVTDYFTGCGPIGGIHAGLMRCKGDLLMVTACDMPLMKAEFFCYLSEMLYHAEQETEEIYDGVVPAVSGRIHPLAAIYRKRAVSVLEAQIRDGNYRLRDALKRMRILYVDVSGNDQYVEMLRNINTAEEYERLTK